MGQVLAGGRSHPGLVTFSWKLYLCLQLALSVVSVCLSLAHICNARSKTLQRRPNPQESTPSCHLPGNPIPGLSPNFPTSLPSFQMCKRSCKTVILWSIWDLHTTPPHVDCLTQVLQEFCTGLGVSYFHVAGPVLCPKRLCMFCRDGSEGFS